LYDEMPPGYPRMVILSSDKQLDILANGRHFLFDGTFATAPDGFEQLITFHVEVRATFIFNYYVIILKYYSHSLIFRFRLTTINLRCMS
jgi:hypothetical protein